jgi:hypothetical protein
MLSAYLPFDLNEVDSGQSSHAVCLAISVDHHPNLHCAGATKSVRRRLAENLLYAGHLQQRQASQSYLSGAIVHSTSTQGLMICAYGDRGSHVLCCTSGPRCGVRLGCRQPRPLNPVTIVSPPFPGCLVVFSSASVCCARTPCSANGVVGARCLRSS